MDATVGFDEYFLGEVECAILIFRYLVAPSCDLPFVTVEDFLEEAVKGWLIYRRRQSRHEDFVGKFLYRSLGKG